MPATLVHCAAIDLLPEREELPGEMVEALAAEPEAGRLGALLPDLPYFERFWAEVANHVLARPPLPSPWARLLHNSTPSLLGENLLRALRSDAGSLGPKGPAIVAGYHCHVAFDLSHHYLIASLTDRIHREEGGDAAVIHRRIEKFHSLFLLEELTGGEVIGTPSAAERLRLRKNGRGLDGRAASYLAKSFRGAFGRSPGEEKIRRWAGGVESYAGLVAGPLGRWERRRSGEDRRNYVDALGKPSRRLLDEALGFTAALCRAAWDLHRSPPGDEKALRDYRSRIPDDNLSFPEKNYLS